MITQLGNDPFGEVITGKLNEIGVDTSYVTYTDEANTALAFVSLKADGDRVFSFYRKPSADMLYEPYMLSPYMFDDCYALHFCSVSLGDFPMKKAHKAAITLASSHGAIISFDPNLRLMLWDSADKLTSAVLEFLPECDILKVSEEELEFITGSSDISTAILRFCRQSQACDMHLRRQGSLCCKCRRNGFLPAVPVEAVDTTGAGDGFIGAFSGVSNPMASDARILVLYHREFSKTARILPTGSVRYLSEETELFRHIRHTGRCRIRTAERIDRRLELN